MCAMVQGRSVATTMSFSPLDGLTMGTRCGRLDAAVVLYLMRSRGMSADEVEKLLRLAKVAPKRTILIGDRVERDGAVAARLNMRSLILSERASPDVTSFASFEDALFQPLLMKTA